MELFFLLQSLFTLSLFIYLLVSFSRRKPASNSIAIRGLKTYPVVGNLPDFVMNRHRFLDWMTEVLAQHPTQTVTFRRPGGVRGILTANPAIVEHMLKTNFGNYPKGERFIFLLRDFLGRGIFNSDGDLWKVQRKTASFEFNTKSLRNFVIDAVHRELEDRLLPVLERASRTGETLDLQDTLERFAFDNVCRVAFNHDPACLTLDRASLSNFAASFEDATTLSAGRFMYLLPALWKIKRLFNIGSEQRLSDSISIVHNFAAEIIRRRKTEKDGALSQDQDLLSRFMAAHGCSEDDFLRDIVVSFILAGRDTTSSALTWFFWLLPSTPHVEQNILKEINSVRTKHQNFAGSFTLDQLRDMHYLHAAISEAIRLYPPVPVDTKECLEDDTLPDGTCIRKGWFISYSAYSMGRLEGLWGADCLSFDPERWLENGLFRSESQFKFPVFHAGPRICLGKEMAYIQMKSIAASVLERFEVEIVRRSAKPEQVLSLTIRMKGGLAVRVRRRCLESSTK